MEQEEGRKIKCGYCHEYHATAEEVRTCTRNAQAQEVDERGYFVSGPEVDWDPHIEHDYEYPQFYDGTGRH